MVGKEDIIGGAAGAGVGVAAVFLLREFVDKQRAEPIVKGIGGFGEISSLVGIATGIPALAIGIYDIGKKTMPSSVQIGLITYGSSAIVTGVISGLRPVREAIGAVPVVGMPVVKLVGAPTPAVKIVETPAVIQTPFGNKETEVFQLS